MARACGYALDVLKTHSSDVMKSLGRGYSERVYHRALITALNKAGYAHRSEVVCPVWYKGECVGYGTADLVLDSTIVEIKAANAMPPQAVFQLRKYLHSLSHAESKKYDGLLLNFNQKSGQVDLATLKLQADGMSVDRLT